MVWADILSFFQLSKCSLHLDFRVAYSTAEKFFFQCDIAVWIIVLDTWKGVKLDHQYRKVQWQGYQPHCYHLAYLRVTKLPLSPVCLTRLASEHIALEVTNTLQNQKIETFPVVVLNWVDERNFYGYTSTINGTEEEEKCWRKSHFPWKLFVIILSTPFWSWFLLCIFQPTRNCTALYMLFMYPFQICLYCICSSILFQRVWTALLLLFWVVQESAVWLLAAVSNANLASTVQTSIRHAIHF